MQAAARVGTSPNRGAEFAQYNLVRVRPLAIVTPESARREPGELQCDHARTPSVRCTHVAVLQGVAYLYGFGVRRDARIAAKWFELSGLPEGMMALAVQVPQFRVRPTVEDSPLRAPFLP